MLHRPGAYFGELALLHGKRRAATVVAATDVSLLVLARNDFAELLTPLQAKLEQQAADYAPLPAPQQQPAQPQVAACFAGVGLINGNTMTAASRQASPCNVCPVMLQTCEKGS